MMVVGLGVSWETREAGGVGMNHGDADPGLGRWQCQQAGHRRWCWAHTHLSPWGFKAMPNVVLMAEFHFVTWLHSCFLLPLSPFPQVLGVPLES